METVGYKTITSDNLYPAEVVEVERLATLFVPEMNTTLQRIDIGRETPQDIKAISAELGVLSHYGWRLAIPRTVSELRSAFVQIGPKVSEETRAHIEAAIREQSERELIRHQELATALSQIALKQDFYVALVESYEDPSVIVGRLKGFGTVSDGEQLGESRHLKSSPGGLVQRGGFPALG